MALEQDPRERLVPDVLLERYLADDLPAAQRRAIERRCQETPAVQARLEALRASRSAFLAAAPPAAFAERVAARLAVEVARHDVGRAAARVPWWAIFLGPSLAAAAVLLVAVTFSRYAGDAPRGAFSVGAASEAAAPSAAADAPAEPPAAPLAEPAKAVAPATEAPGPAEINQGLADLSVSQPRAWDQDELRLDGRLGSSGVGTGAGGLADVKGPRGQAKARAEAKRDEAGGKAEEKASKNKDAPLRALAKDPVKKGTGRAAEPEAEYEKQAQDPPADREVDRLEEVQAAEGTRADKAERSAAEAAPAPKTKAPPAAKPVTQPAGERRSKAKEAPPGPPAAQAYGDVAAPSPVAGAVAPEPTASSNRANLRASDDANAAAPAEEPGEVSAPSGAGGRHGPLQAVLVAQGEGGWRGASGTALAGQRLAVQVTPAVSTGKPVAVAVDGRGERQLISGWKPADGGTWRSATFNLAAGTWRIYVLWTPRGEAAVLGLLPRRSQPARLDTAGEQIVLQVRVAGAPPPASAPPASTRE